MVRLIKTVAPESGLPAVSRTVPSTRGRLDVIGAIDSAESPRMANAIPA